MLKEKGGSAKIKQAIFHIAPAPPLSINNDRSLTFVRLTWYQLPLKISKENSRIVDSNVGFRTTLDRHQLSCSL